MREPTPYPEINAILADVLASVQSILGPRFLGMYLYGSLALGDFSPTESDIDYVVVTGGPLPGDVVEQLAAMHERLASEWAPWGWESEGSYIPERILREKTGAQAGYPGIERGEKLVIKQYQSGGLIQRYLLREYGIPLAGPPVTTWIEPVGPDDLRRDVVSAAREWLIPIRDNPRRWLDLRSRGYRSYIVLTICRMLYTLELGTVVSKPAAARWAMSALGNRWASLIERAAIDDTEATLEIVRFAADRLIAEPDAAGSPAKPAAAAIVGLDHVQVAAPRREGVEDEARGFYSGLLGLTEIEKPEALKPKGGVWFSTGSGQLHVGLEEPFAPARKAHPAFLVNGLAGLRERLEAAGVRTTEAEDIPGVERFYADDPFGNRIELMERV